MIFPMPSPRGTNYEGLYILRGRRSTPEAAYDSAMTPEQAAAYAKREVRRLHAKDSAMPDDKTAPFINDNGDDPVAQLIAWCRDNLNPDERQQLATALNDTDNKTMDNRRRQRRAPAMDSNAAAAYASRFPDAATVRNQCKW